MECFLATTCLMAEATGTTTSQIYLLLYLDGLQYSIASGQVEASAIVKARTNEENQVFNIVSMLLLERLQADVISEAPAPQWKYSQNREWTRSLFISPPSHTETVVHKGYWNLPGSAFGGPRRNTCRNMLVGQRISHRTI